MSRSKIALLLCFVALIFGKSFFSGEWTFGGTISWDVFGYYLYLPATFIHGDPTLSDLTWVRSLMDQYQPSTTLYQVWSVQEGSNLIKYPMGLAISYLPGFLVGHFIAWITGAPMDGMSMPYQISIIVTSFIYLFIGLAFLRKLLLRYFSDKVVALTLLLTILGTNLLLIASNNSLTPHPLQFALYSTILYYIDCWYRTQNKRDFNLFVFLWAFALLGRPSAFVLLPLVLFWKVGDGSALKTRLRWWFVDNRKFIYRGALIMLCVALPQMIYWFFTTGKPIFYSYPNDGFDFLTPYVTEVLFSYRKGWWLYTPLMFLSLVGLYSLWKKDRALSLPLILFWVFNLYIVSSWNAWWYGGSFGHRAFLDSYGIYAFSIAAFVAWLGKSSWLWKIPVISLILAAVGLNLFQSWQMNHWMLSDQMMTKAYYWRVFGKTSVTPEDRLYLGIARGPETSFDRSLGYDLILDTVVLGIESNPTRWEPGSFNFELPMDEFHPSEHSWWIIDAVVSTEASSDVWMRIKTLHKDKNIKVREMTMDSLSDGTIGIHYEYLTPLLKSNQDVTRVFFSSSSNKTIDINKLRVQIYSPTWYEKTNSN